MKSIILILCLSALTFGCSTTEKVFSNIEFTESAENAQGQIVDNLECSRIDITVIKCGLHMYYENVHMINAYDNLCTFTVNGQYIMHNGDYNLVCHR